MRTKVVVLLLAAHLLTSAAALAESELFRRFKDCYGQLGSDLGMRPPAELAQVSSFVYQKDIATFTFEEGRLYLLRKLEGRPTTAIFIGRGHARIEMPSHVESQSLLFASRKPAVDEKFEMAFINFSDDFDLRLRERFQFEQTVLPWADFNRSQQGEFFFKPVVMHQYDNYFQLLRSLFERKGDGFFWIDFNRYVYMFDPNRPEPVTVAYEHEGGDDFMTDGASLQRMELGVYDDYRMSDIAYPSTILDRTGELRMVGLDGKNIDRAAIDLKILVNADSLRFVSLFLHHNLGVDSIIYRGQPVDFWRRGSFTFMGILLPEYRRRGDTLDLRVVYHGTKYHQVLPFVENPAATPHTLTFDIHTGYNYVMPAVTPLESSERGRTRFMSAPSEPCRMFQFQPYASGFDTATVVSDIGITLNFLRSGHIDKSHYECFIPSPQYEPTVVAAFNFMTGRLGPPPSTFAEFIYPEPSPTMPGLMGVSQTTCHVDGTGGLLMEAAEAASRQYFGALMQPKTDREYWLMEAVPDYLSLMAVWHELDPGIFFGELRRRRDYIYDLLDLNNDRPLGTGRRVESALARSKGSWLLHMLRFMMYDLEGQGNRDQTFWRFLNELKTMVNTTPYTNESFIRLAEKHYGDSLDWFFHHWLFGRNIPEYNVQYQIVKRDDAHYITAAVSTEKVDAKFEMPVIIRVASEGGQSVYVRQLIEGQQTTFELGPFAFTPKEMIFNEFHSVLSRDKVKKK
ncbi:MAG: hypothetical protein AB1772_01750 [Candidatus Zixiibacteriota bacterium]